MAKPTVRSAGRHDLVLEQTETPATDRLHSAVTSISTRIAEHPEALLREDVARLEHLLGDGNRTDSP